MPATLPARGKKSITPGSAPPIRRRPKKTASSKTNASSASERTKSTSLTTSSRNKKSPGMPSSRKEGPNNNNNNNNSNNNNNNNRGLSRIDRSLSEHDVTSPSLPASTRTSPPPPPPPTLELTVTPELKAAPVTNGSSDPDPAADLSSSSVFLTRDEVRAIVDKTRSDLLARLEETEQRLAASSERAIGIAVDRRASETEAGLRAELVSTSSTSAEVVATAIDEADVPGRVAEAVRANLETVDFASRVEDHVVHATDEIIEEYIRSLDDRLCGCIFYR